MELNKEQLQRVEHYLDKKNITYIDVRLEVLDHIISDIETKMETKKLDFETVFYNVTQKWNTHLEQASSYYFGLAYSQPKIVLEKAKKHFKKWFFLSFLSFLIPLLVINKINFSFLESLKNELNLLFQVITVVTFIFFFVLFVLKLMDKKKTTFSFILKTQIWNLLIGFIVLFDFDYLNKHGNLDTVQTCLLFAFMFSAYSYFHFYKKHKAAIKKYKIL